MADSTQRPGPGLFDDSRFVSVAACIVAVVVILVGGHLYGRYLADKDLGGRDNVIAQLQVENQQVKRNIDQKSAQLSQLQAKLDKLKPSLSRSCRPRTPITSCRTRH